MNYFFTLGGKLRGVPSSGLTGEGHKLEHPPGPIRAPPHMGHGSGLGGV